jgi:hypothetical protein
MLPSEVGEFARVCTDVANSVRDRDGFVAVRSLLQRFGADLRLRPLLVEAILAHDKDSRWTVLVDAEKFPITQSQIDSEKATQPLPDRFRNTVSHELIHSLPFRVREFGIRLKKPADSRTSQSEFVQHLEQHIERLSPLLLLPQDTLKSFLSQRIEPLSLKGLTELRHKHGLSRYVVLNRLNLLPATDDNRRHVGLRNVGFGIGEWRNGNAVLRKWPLFRNFERNLIPSFLNRLAAQDYLPLGNVAPTMILNGGVTDFDCAIGTPAVPDSENAKVRMTVEDPSRKRDVFLFSVQKL